MNEQIIPYKFSKSINEHTTQSILESYDTVSDVVESNVQSYFGGHIPLGPYFGGPIPFGPYFGGHSPSPV